MAIQLQLRRDSAANWTSANPTLLEGEIGYETDTGSMKVGDGATAWASLAYWTGSGSSGDMVLASVQTVTGAKTFNSGKLILAGSSSGTTTLNAAATAGSGTVVLPTTGTLATLAGSEALTNKTVNGLTITSSTGTLTVTNGKTAAFSNSLTFTGTDGSTLNVGTGGTLGTLAFQSGTFSGSHSGTSSGTNTGDQTITLTGDVTGSGTGSFAATIANSAVTLAKMANMATASFIGRTTASTGVPEVLSATQATAILNAFVGDSGSGGTKGLVPAPSSGDSSKFLKGDGTWATGGSGAGYGGTSTTSVSFGTGSKTWTTQSGLAYINGSRIRAVETGSSQWMEGEIISYSGSTLNVSVDLFSGVGTYSTWAFSVAGVRGATGAGFSDADYGDVTISGGVTSITIDNSAVTNAKMANMSASTIKARVTGSTGAPEDATLSQVLDFVGSAAQGDILYRGSSTWTRLGAGTTGQFLKTQGTGADPTWVGMPFEICIKCSDETTAITTGTNKARFRMPFAATLTAVRAAVNTQPTGSTIIIDINESGTTVMSTNKLSIDASESTSVTAATPAGITDSALADDAEISIDFDQVGSSTAGAGVSVWLIGTRTI